MSEVRKINFGTKRKYNETKDTLKETRLHRCCNKQCKKQHWTLEESKTKIFLHETGKSSKCAFCSKNIEFHVEGDKWRQASYFTSTSRKKIKVSEENETDCTNEIPFSSKNMSGEYSFTEEPRQREYEDLSLLLDSLLEN
jgi:hypothetical protein